MGSLAKRIIGMILFIVGCLGYLFFGSYKGDRFPYQNLFYFISLFIALSGALLWAFTITKKTKK